MKGKTLIIILLVVAALLAAKFIFFPSESGEVKGPPKGAGGKTNVAAHVLKFSRLSNEVYASGTIMANEEVVLQPELSGKIVQLNFSEGSAVAKGQLLVKINDAELQAQFKKLKLQESLAGEKLERQKKLLAISGISQEEFDVAQSQYDVIRADLDFASAQIAKTEIRAPFNGVIGLKSVSEGSYVTPATVIARIQQIDPVKLDFSVSERYSSVVKKGARVEFTVEGSPEKRSAEVYAIEPKIDMNTRTLQVRALCPNSKGSLYPGTFAKIQLALSDIDSALMIPTESIIPDLKGQKVYVLRNGKAEFARVETGVRTDAAIQITSGLKQGDTVVTSGFMSLKPGSQVRITSLKQ